MQIICSFQGVHQGKYLNPELFVKSGNDYSTHFKNKYYILGNDTGPY